ncbi:polyubiquitin-like [Phragmites australis]|uniref:polyubiquitin-like n=1 Tax=Phragmites australis TaxID=29695 RepID=UPI002D78C4D6|nr:polyubiquitin-like [Phragmites australis]
MDVTFETTLGRRFTIQIWYFSTVRRIKEYILRYEGIPVEAQQLFFMGKELQDDRDTEYYSIFHGSHVLLVLPDRVAVFFDKVEMEDHKELAEYDPPVDGMEVRVVVTQPPQHNNTGAKKHQWMTVKVRRGLQMVVLEVSNLDVVKELRTELGKVAPHFLQTVDGVCSFVYKQNVMDEDRTLHWHEVKNCDTIEILNNVVTRGD